MVMVYGGGWGWKVNIDTAFLEHLRRIDVQYSEKKFWYCEA